MEFRKVLVQSRRLPAQHIQMLWENIYRHNVKIEILSSILAFYLHHREYHPPLQKAFDTLQMAFIDSKMSKRLRTLLFQTVEEMSPWLSPSCISETMRVSINPSVVTGLLPCLLINNMPDLEIAVYERLISSVTSAGVSQEDRCKVLGFLMTTLPAELHPMFNEQLITWLSYNRTAHTKGNLFRSADVSEVDGSPSIGTCTPLTLVSTVTDGHMISLVVFSNIRKYLYLSQDCVNSSLLNTVLVYCTTLLAQASRKPNNTDDKLLIPAVLEEILLVMKAVREVDISYRGRCQLMVGNIQHLSDQLGLTQQLISVWEYQLFEGEESALTERMLTAKIRSEFSQGAVGQKLAGVVMCYGSRLAHSLARYSPNLLKLVATHPSVLVEEFLQIVPHLASTQDLVVEVFHCLLDLPVLSASICVHQSALLFQAGFKVPILMSAKHLMETEHRAVYRHMLRSEAVSGQTEDLLKQYLGYWSAVRPVLSFGLVEVTSQVTPLLLDAFLEAVVEQREANSILLPAVLTRASLLCPLPSYQQAVLDLLVQYIQRVITSQPELMESNCVVQFLSVTNHAKICPELFNTIVSAVGDHVTTEKIIVNIFESLEALLREHLMDKTWEDLKLQTSVCTALAKLSSRHVSLIQRANTAFEKLSQTLQGSTEEEKEEVLRHTKELIAALKNPRVTSVLLSPSTKEDVALSALLRVMFQILE